jgi:hypothetical protein
MNLIYVYYIIYKYQSQIRKHNYIIYHFTVNINFLTNEKDTYWKKPNFLRDFKTETHVPMNVGLRSQSSDKE